MEPNVKILSLTIKSADRPDIVLPIPEGGRPKGIWFTLKEGSRYRLMFTFQVENNIVSGLKYTNSVWRSSGMKVSSRKEMLGTFSPRAAPYTHEMREETTPKMFAKGSYSAASKFVDDDNECLVMEYCFDIRKEWQ